MTALVSSPDWDSAALQQIAEQVLSLAKQQGATSAEVGASMSNGLSVAVRMGEVETLEHYQDRSLAITVYKGARKGSATTTDFSSAAVSELVSAACSIAEFTAEDKYAGLADANLMAQSATDLDLYRAWPISVEDIIELAQHCEAVALQEKGIENSDSASVTRYGGYALYANSHGFIGGYASSRHSIGCTVIAGKGDTMQRDYWYSSARHPEALDPAEQIGKKAAQRAVARLNARKIKTGCYPVLFAPEMARSLLGNFVAAIRGSALYRKTSFLLGHKGKAVFPSFVQIKEEPHLLRALGSAPFDSEGVQTCARNIVCDGILQDYVLDSYSARRLGTQTTGNAGGVHNLEIQAGDDTQSDLLRKMERGLLLTEMMGQGVNLVTGDYSRGATGFWIENGEIQYPVEEITVAGNLSNMFHDVVAVGNDIDTRGTIRSGSILVGEMTVAGS